MDIACYIKNLFYDCGNYVMKKLNKLLDDREN